MLLCINDKREYRKFQGLQKQKAGKERKIAGKSWNYRQPYHRSIFYLRHRAMYFLFENYYLFAFFAILHLTGDALDGVVARLHKPTRYGKYFDLLSDSIVTFLALIKVGFYVQDFYPFIAAGLFLTALAINLRSGLQAPMFL